MVRVGQADSDHRVEPIGRFDFAFIAYQYPTEINGRIVQPCLNICVHLVCTPFVLAKASDTCGRAGLSYEVTACVGPHCGIVGVYPGCVASLWGGSAALASGCF